MYEERTTYSERLRIAWFGIWRGVLVNGLLGFAWGFLVGYSSHRLSLRGWVTPVSAIGSAALGILVGSPIIVTMMVRKQFRGFRVRIVRGARSN